MDPVAPVIPVAVDPGPATTQMPAIDSGAIDRPPAPTSPSGERPLDMEQTMVLDEQANEQKDRSLERVNAVIARSPARKRSLGEESETAPEGRTSVNGKGKAVARESDDINEPARKRQRTTEESATPTPVSTPNPPALLPKQPLVTELHDFGSMTPSNPPARIQVVEEFLPTDDFNGPTMSNASSSETDANDSMKAPLLDDDAADPTPYELSPEACAFLRGEAARGFARFVKASTRVQPLERQLDQENRNLEMRRSELLRVMLMLPREDRTTIWTNMGQPDARTLLGLLPEPSSSIKRSSDVQNQVGRTEDASSSSSSKASVPNSSTLSRKSNQGLLEVQKVQAKASSKQKLQSRLQMERDKDSEAMPPPPLPVIRSAGTSQRPSIARLSQRRHGSSSQRPRSSVSTAPEQSGSSIREHPYCAQLRQAVDDARKAYPGGVFSFSVPPEILAWEGRSTRKYPYPTPKGRVIARTPHTRITELTAVPELKVIKPPNWKAFEAKRKREDTEDTEDSQALVPAALEPKRRKTENCDLV
ncbi:hypothetical protein JB92DRAFT_322017 [Gautieria morchelliformis]|nr:hypothetical protein JB92DRAFT_322017 [Gautieria morchelliformis]